MNTSDNEWLMECIHGMRAEEASEGVKQSQGIWHCDLWQKDNVSFREQHGDHVGQLLRYTRGSCLKATHARLRRHTRLHATHNFAYISCRWAAGGIWPALLEYVLHRACRRWQCRELIRVEPWRFQYMCEGQVARGSQHRICWDATNIDPDLFLHVSP